MKKRWTKHLPSSEDQKKFVAYVKNNKELLDHIILMLREDLDAATRKQRSRDAYDKAEWPYFQASMLGEQRALDAVIDLLTME